MILPSTTSTRARLLIAQQTLPTTQLINIRDPPGIPLVALCFLAQQDCEDLDRRVQIQSAGAQPAVQSCDPDAGAVLAGEVEVAEDLFVEGHGGLVDCDSKKGSVSWFEVGGGDRLGWIGMK